MSNGLVLRVGDVVGQDCRWVAVVSLGRLWIRCEERSEKKREKRCRYGDTTAHNNRTTTATSGSTIQAELLLLLHPVVVVDVRDTPSVPAE